MVNFLPWREYERLYQNKIMKRIIVFAICVSAAAITVVHGLLAKHATILNKRISQLQSNIREASARQKVPSDQSYLLDAEFSKNILAFHNLTATFFTEWAQPHQANVCFADVMRKKNVFTVEGYARSNSDLMNFFKNWQAAYLFSQIKINQLTQENHRIHFQFQANQTHSLF